MLNYCMLVVCFMQHNVLNSLQDSASHVYSSACTMYLNMNQVGVRFYSFMYFYLLGAFGKIFRGRIITISPRTSSVAYTEVAIRTLNRE